MTDERQGRTGIEASVPRWERPPRWYLWDGGFMSVGTSTGVIPPHAHHAIQIVIAVEGATAIRGSTGEWRRAAGTIVRQDVEHSYSGNGATGAMIFVDPESSEGTWLGSAMTGDITTVPDTRLVRSVDALRTFLDRPFEAMEVGDLIRHCVASCCTGVPPARRLDERVTAVLKAIRESDDLRMPLEDAADRAHLSPSRFAHLFKQQVGLPFRRYMLWRKLTRAMLSIGRERTLAAAAHASDFADAAHLTRTFYQMFGIQPSLLMRGEFFEIPSPFNTSD
jgi:AraC family transcriptional regulator